MMFSIAFSAMLLAQVAYLPTIANAEGLCLMIYQMADNDLEFFIREDNAELSQSQLVRDDSVTTWIYFDHRNLGEGRTEDIPWPLDSVYNADGSEVTGQKTESSQYFRWDHSLDKMVIDRTLPGEQNSDLPETVTAWCDVAMQDCVDKGADSFMVAFSSHGGGFEGFGSDHNTDNGRKLYQSNDDIVYGLRDCLNNVDGAPTKFDVIGFDACYMSAFGSADNFLVEGIADYLLASEPVEPGHGWAYNVLADGSNAVNLAKEIQATFLSEKQGSSHDNPKILALVDLEKFETFLQDWDALGAEMKRLLDSKDPDFFVQLNRARNNALSFEHSIDLPDTKVGAALDIGHFLKTLKAFCNPEITTEIRILMDSAELSYNDMFVVRGSGDGTTQRATGMHITWPTKTAYVGDKEYLDPRLYEEPYGTTDAPNWLEFLKTYYATTTPPESDVGSVCSLGATPCEDPEPGQLLINPSLTGVLSNGAHSFETTIAREVDEVFVEFGADVSPIIDQFLDVGRRRLHKKQSADDESSLAVEQSKEDQAASGNNRSRRLMDSSNRNRHRRGRYGRRASSSVRRSLQDDGELSDYFLVFGGDLLGDYKESTFSALWNRNFYLYEDGDGNLDTLYVYDMGDGAFEIPVIYLPPQNNITKDILFDTPVTTPEIDFVEDLGGEFGYISFSTLNANSDGVISDGFTLFTNDGDTYSEKPKSAGGQVIPVQYVEGNLQGVEIYELIGGFTATLINWNEGTDFSVLITPGDALLEAYELDDLILDVLAFDNDALLLDDEVENAVEFVYFDIAKDGTIDLISDGDVFLGGGACVLEEEEESAGSCIQASIAMFGSALLAYLFSMA